MAGGWINDRQRNLYMTSRQQGDGQERAATRSAISERSGRRIEHGTGGPGHRKPRTHRTRHDPLAEVWESELLPMLNHSPNLKAVTLLEYLQETHPGQFPNSIRRTLERRIKQWRALQGPEQEVIFRQIHQPGWMGISDFSHPKERYAITIRGKEQKHILFHYRMPFSGWCFVRAVEGGESFVALSRCLNEALQRLGGAPHTHRTDSLAAAYKNLSKSEQEDATQRYQALCDHYGMKPTRNNRGVSHENGAIESPHGHIKQRIGQALILRGSNDFDNLDAFNRWLDTLISKLNRRCRDKQVEEQTHLTPLPPTRGVDYSEDVVRVSSSSTIAIKKVLYTVPSRLIGEQLRVHIHDRHLELFCGTAKAGKLDRIFAKGNHRVRHINYLHVIDSLVKKPQAFRHSVLRDDLLPNDQMRAIWKRADNDLDPHFACKFMVKVLHIAAKGACLQALGDWLQEQATLPPLHKIQDRFHPAEKSAFKVRGGQHILTEYDNMLQGVKS